MSNRVWKKSILTAAVLVCAILILHGYFWTGLLNRSKPGYAEVARMWRDSNRKIEAVDPKANEGCWTIFNYQVNSSPRKTPNVARINEVNDAPVHTRPACQRNNNIGFFKMHKCGSSTMQNILMRYGVRYDLDFVLPPYGNYLGHTYFNKRLVMPSPVHKYNILCHHTRFSKEGFDSVLPRDALYVTIIRDPATMYESTYTYLQYQSRYGVPLTTFLENPDHYYQPNKGKDHAKDSMLFDLGLENDLKINPVAVDKKIQRIASDFDLVMLTEHFSESLILLKELMCWDFEDIAYFKMNARSASSVKIVTDKTAERIRRWNDGDTKLYNYFNRTFWEKVRDFGEERMRMEVAKLEEMNRMMKDRCIDRVVINDKQVWHPSGINVESFRLKPSADNDAECKLMTKPEFPFTSCIRQLQLAKYFGRKSPAL